MGILKVSTGSKPTLVAKAIAISYRENKEVEVQAIGAGAVNQAVKAIAIAKGLLAPSGVNLFCTPSFSDINIEGEERTAIKFLIVNK